MNDNLVDIRKWRPRTLKLCAIPLMVTATQNKKNEWATLAQAAYRQQLNDIGHTYSVAASLPNGGQVTVKRFDELQANYLQWLSCGKVTLADGRTVLVQNS